VSQAIKYRRSVRIFDANKPIDPLKVKKCIEQAIFAPNSSNIQLWEFHHIVSDEMKINYTPYVSIKMLQKQPNNWLWLWFEKIYGEKELKLI